MNGIIGKYHVSKNLFDATWESGSIGNAGGNLSDTNAIRTVGFIVCEAGKLYSFNPEYDVTETWVNYYDNNGGLSRYKITDGTFTTPQGCTRLRFRLSKTDIGVAPVPQPLPMLNVGTPLPYEPYDTEVWHDISYARLESATDTLSALPVTIYGDGTNATVTIKGNMSQSGTATPSSPITPSECGERTDNYFDKSNPNELNAYFSEGVIREGNGYKMVYIPCEPNTKYTVSKILTYRFSIAQFDHLPTYGSTNLTNVYRNNDTEVTLTTEPTAAYLVVFLYTPQDTVSLTDIYDSLMINKGEPRSYEPYGYKLSVISGGVTTNAYLGEVQSTRKIMKIVLTGNESGWTMGTSQFGKRFGYALISAMESTIDLVRSVCSHVPLTYSGGTYANPNTYTIGSNQVFNISLDASYTTLDQFLDWLKAEHAAGTPVTVWYVLATETTGIVNEPIRKIGDYADSVSVTNTPTITGGQTFDIDTSLKPSEVSLTYHGWHEHEPLKRENGQWV